MQIMSQFKSHIAHIKLTLQYYMSKILSKARRKESYS